MTAESSISTRHAAETAPEVTGRPLAGAELTLTPHVSAWEQEARADAPAEERVTVTSDATGCSGVLAGEQVGVLPTDASQFRARPAALDAELAVDVAQVELDGAWGHDE